MATVYTPEQREQVLELWPEHGTAETARITGVAPRTILRYVTDAGLMTHDRQEKTEEARAAAAEKVSAAWGDFRAQEALAAGSAANRMRREVLEASTAASIDIPSFLEQKDLRLLKDWPALISANANLLKARVIAYGIFIDKAELLSGQATSRIELWAESQVDRDLRSAMEELEDRIRAEG